MIDKAKISCNCCSNLIEINITENQIQHWHDNKCELPLIQDHFPKLTDAEIDLITIAKKAMKYE